MNEKEMTKSETAKREEEILKFWRENKIFEKTLEKESPKGEFVFYDGPPFATGLPHYGSLLSSIIKDVIPRYKTMQGYHVRRRWGWDCHGLPIENMVEKKLGLKTKKDIEAMGVDKFNKTCRDAVLETAGDWKKYIERIGRWVEFDGAYKTMDNSYIESVWWAFKEMWNKGLIYEGRKVLMYCPRCETSLSKAEVAMDHSYKDVTEEAITVKFKLKPGQKLGNFETDNNTYILAWTTTPWTLPANLALAVNEKIEYFIVRQNGDKLILASKNEPQEEKIKGKDLVGLEYESLFGASAHHIAAAEFVTTKEGTGIVHIAPMYGEDDYNLGLKLDLPMTPLLDQSGHFNPPAGGQVPEFIRGQHYKKANKIIIEELEKRQLIFSKEKHTHSYPHCHRCETPLIYNAVSSWFINIQKVKKRLIELNEKINWVPGHLKHGRFLKIVEDAPDWNISRNRYWASPLPIWRCKRCGEKGMAGSIEELKNKTKKSGNKYFVMRHGEAESNVRNLVSSKLENSHKYPLTERGGKQVADSGEKLIGQKIDFIFYSPFERTKETAFIVAGKIGLTEENVISDKRLAEINAGIFDSKPVEDYDSYFPSYLENFTKNSPEGEDLNELKKRMGGFIYDIDKKYSGKNILIISHEYPIWMLYSAVNGLNEKEAVRTIEERGYFINMGEFIELPFVPFPHDKNFIVDLHRPYIDEIDVVCNKCGGEMKRVPEVLDGWFESASMPFAEYHYPFENSEHFKKRFPGDFVAEYIAQTRTWFYYMHVVAAILFDDIVFKNVLTTGNILAEDGSKMSKSKGNYTDPMVNLDRYGADALRYCLMASVVMQAEDIKFSDNEIKEAQNKVINILRNTFKFFEIYKKDHDGQAKPEDSGNVLDKWILARLGDLIREVAENFDKYDTVKAGRPIKDFINDFSTWYIRRSRERVKLNDEKDKQFSLATMKFVLLELSKVIAPLTPFMAEEIYKGVGGEKESVHLEEWAASVRATASQAQLIKDMDKVRKIVSLGLEARSKAGIRVRQPLQKLKIKNLKFKIDKAFLELIKDELNVKEVIYSDKISNEVELDTAITPDLKEEGELRELIRALQDARKKAGLSPGQKIALQVSADSTSQKFLEKFKDGIAKAAGVEKIELISDVKEGQEIKINDKIIRFEILDLRF